MRLPESHSLADLLADVAREARGPNSVRHSHDSRACVAVRRIGSRIGGFAPNCLNSGNHLEQ